MNHCLSGLRDSVWIPYLDDILCYDKSLGEHSENLRNILKQLKQFVVKLTKKTIFFKCEVKYPGKIINEKEHKDDGIIIVTIEK